MKQTIIYFILGILIFTSCYDNHKEGQNKKNSATIMTDSIKFKSGFSVVNGIKMYYETYGQGTPLVLIHGGGSTIQSSFERIIPGLSKNYSIIAVELQNHGRSGFRNVPETFEQDADDVASLLGNIGISKASFFGFSNGGTTALQIAIRHSKIVNKLVLASASYKRDGFVSGFFEGMQQATLVNMPQELKAAFLKVNPDTAKLQIMFERDRDRMIEFKDINEEQIELITAPTLVINGDADVVRPEHALKMHHEIPNCQLAIIPGGHGKYIGEITTLSNDNRYTEFTMTLVKEFLDKPNQ